MPSRSDKDFEVCASFVLNLLRLCEPTVVFWDLSSARAIWLQFFCEYLYLCLPVSKCRKVVPEMDKPSLLQLKICCLEKVSGLGSNESVLLHHLIFLAMQIGFGTNSIIQRRLLSDLKQVWLQSWKLVFSVMHVLWGFFRHLSDIPIHRITYVSHTCSCLSLKLVVVAMYQGVFIAVYNITLMRESWNYNFLYSMIKKRAFVTGTRSSWYLCWWRTSIYQPNYQKWT